MTIFKCNDGRAVEIDYCDTVTTVWTTSNPREKVGSFSFMWIEGDNTNQSYYLVTSMHLEGAGGTYLRQGIGREIIKTIASDYGPVAFSRPYGIQSQDGSHLTEDGPVFAIRMVSDKLANWDGIGDNY